MIRFYDPKVLRRFIILMGLATFIMFSIWMMIYNYKGQTEGDYEVRQGDILLSDGSYEEAIQVFNNALKLQPNHRGALSGQAVALMELGKILEAERTFTYLIDFLKITLEKDDLTGRGALSAAYGNRGILKDRSGRHQEALKDYIESIRIDLDIAEGPGIIEQILYYDKKPSSILKRAEYLHKQFKLSESERVMRNFKEDAKQRRYKP